MRVAADSTNVSVIIRVVDATDGTPETGVVAATPGLALGYWREGAAAFVGLTESDLASLDAAHSDGGLLHIADGFYRIDLPDAAFAAGANQVLISAVATGMVGIGQIVEIGPTLDALSGRLPAALVSGRIDASVGAIAANAITAAAIATDAIDADALAADAIAEINATVDAALLDVGLTTVVTGRIDAAVSTRLAAAGYTAPDNSGIAAILEDTGVTLPGLITALNNISVADILTSALTESYAAQGAAPTLTQAVLEILQWLTEKSVIGTTATVKRRNQSTTAATYTLNDATTPTAITRAT